MNYLFIDFEATYTPTVNLKKMTLRKYVLAADVLGMGAMVRGYEPSFYLPAELADPELLADLRAIAEDPDWAVVAHNAAYDIRVWRFKLGLPQPQNVYCTLELACGAFPNQPGGYSLDSLSKTLNLDGWVKGGKGSGVMKMTAAELAEYCKGDVIGCQKVFERCLPNLHPDELAIARLANQARELWFNVDLDAVAKAYQAFSKIAHDSASVAISALTSGGDDAEARGAFGWEESGQVKSVKPAQMKRLLLENVGFDTSSISFKKINPEKLRENTQASKILKATETTNKALSHQRRVRVFSGIAQIDAELGYFRAHTGRFSSPSVGRGLNLHNLSKRDKKVSKAIRSMFRLPDDVCFVRADLANVEYRTAGLLTGCEHICRLFSNNVLSDPYAAFGEAATGQAVDKSMPVRQVWKAGVLALIFSQGLAGWIRVLLLLLADYEQYKVSLADLEDVAAKNGWRNPGKSFVSDAIANTHCPVIVAIVAYYTRELFHRVHPEVKRTTSWLVDTLNRLNQCADADQANRTLDAVYQLPSAPDRNLLDLSWDGRFEGRTVRARCGSWPAATVTWRDIDVRAVGENGYMKLTYMSGKKGYWPLSPSLIIENVASSAARNALCQGKLELQRRGYPYQLSVHDELQLVVPRNVQSVLRARHDIEDVFGPNKLPGWKWAIVVNPAEINVSQSLYEVECGDKWWATLADHPEYLETLS